MMSGAVYAGSFISPVFPLNTSNLIDKVSSAAFNCSTDQLYAREASSLFYVTTDLLQDAQASAIFLCNSQSPGLNSVAFLADTHSTLIDSDANGLPNIWELSYFGSITNTIPTEDDDKDGCDNLCEYIAGTNPKDYQSVFVLSQNDQTGHIEWVGILNRLYTLQFTSDLTVPFSEVAGQTDLLGTGGKIYYPYLMPDENGLYRVEVRVR